MAVPKLKKQNLTKPWIARLVTPPAVVYFAINLFICLEPQGPRVKSFLGEPMPYNGNYLLCLAVDKPSVVFHVLGLCQKGKKGAW